MMNVHSAHLKAYLFCLWVHLKLINVIGLICLFSFFKRSITVDEVQAKVALVHDEERVLSESEAVVS